MMFSDNANKRLNSCQFLSWTTNYNFENHLYACTNTFEALHCGIETFLWNHAVQILKCGERDLNFLNHECERMKLKINFWVFEHEHIAQMFSFCVWSHIGWDRKQLSFCLSFPFGFCFRICGQFLINNLTLVETKSRTKHAFLRPIMTFRSTFLQSAQNEQPFIFLSKFRQLQNLKSDLKLAYAQVFPNKISLHSFKFTACKISNFSRHTSAWTFWFTLKILSC